MKSSTQEYIKTKLSCPIKISGIYTVHYFKYGKNYKFSGESHDFWEMVFIDSGTANIFTDESVRKLTQGQAFFHKPNEHHNISTDDDFANSVIITFECKNKELLILSGKTITLDEFEKSMLNKILHETKINYHDKLNDAYLKKMNKTNKAPFGGEQIIKNCIELLIISILRNDMSEKANFEKIGLSSSSDNIVESVCEILNEMLNNSQNVSLDNLSFRLNFSKSYIKSQFKKKTGYSILQYFINMKIEKAKKLLSQQKYPISEISDMLGFSSVFYFSRQFKAHTDMSPSEYVRSVKIQNIL